MLNVVLKGLLFVLKWVETISNLKGRRQKGLNIKKGLNVFASLLKFLWLPILTTLISGINTVSIEKCKNESRSRFQLTLNL